jgi:16S rRNA (cytidine1402-2'-O)-methyltransferase
MPEKKSYLKIRGELYVVATPLGNLEDISLRALRILRNVFAIACEDTRQTIKILNTYKIKTKLISYFHPKEQQKIPKLLSLLLQGKNIALVSDAGTPGISDPGYPLIREALARGIKVVPIPGPCAITAALSASGLPTHKFHFLSFPSPKKHAMKKMLDTVKNERETLVFYIPARKVPTFLQLIRETLGERQIVLARELTKLHEEFLRGTPSELLFEAEKREIKGEVTLLIEGKPKKRPQP